MPEAHVPPVAPRRPHVHSAHRVDRTDDYAWMTDHAHPELLAHLQAERLYYEEATAGLAPLRERLSAEMVARVPATETSVGWHQGPYLYTWFRPEGREYRQLRRVPLDHPDAPARVLLDVNVLAGPDGHVELGVCEVSPDDRLLAFSVDTAGDERYRIRFRDLDRLDDLPDVIDGAYEGGAWAAGSDVFFWVEADAAWRPYRIRRHRLAGRPVTPVTPDTPDTPGGLVGEGGAPADADPVVLAEPDARFHLSVRLTRSHGLVVITAAARDSTEEWLIPADRPDAAPRCVEPRRAGVEYAVEHAPRPDGDVLVIVTDDGAPEFRLARVGLDRPGRGAWEPLIDDDPTERLLHADVFAGHVVLSLRRDGERVLRVVRRDGTESAIDVHPGIPAGTIALGPNLELDTHEVLVSVSSYTQPTVWYAVDLDTGRRAEVHRQDVPGYDPGAYVCERRWAPAADGTRIPVTLARRRDTPLDGSPPCLLAGYGAYEAVDEPSFDPELPSLLDRGVVFAHSHVRGGGELGRRWWQAGRLRAKPRTFTDHLAVADFLAEGLVDPTRIVTRGVSAGGLLAGAVLTLRPERWAGVVAEDPFVDVVTSMLDPGLPLTATEWAEWGDPRDPDDFAAMMAWSPYDNVTPGLRPPVLVTGSLHDTRVLVHEPAKWVARLRDVDPSPVLFRAETGSGAHAGPRGRFAWLHYQAEIAAFVLDRLGLS